jgi:DNA-binding transcriptional regulator YiaG
MYRTYVWGDQPQRLPQNWSQRTYPLFANTRQKIVSVYFEDDGRWTLSGHPHLFEFDGGGQFDRDHSMRRSHEILALVAARDTDSPQIDEIRKAERAVNANHWRLSKADKARIAADVSGVSPIPFYKAPKTTPAIMNAPQFRATLKAHSLTQTELADRFGIDIRTVNRWATGKLSVPKYVAAYFDALSGNAPTPSRLANGRGASK